MLRYIQIIAASTDNHSIASSNVASKYERLEAAMLLDRSQMRMTKLCRIFVYEDVLLFTALFTAKQHSRWWHTSLSDWHIKLFGHHKLQKCRDKSD